MPDPDIAASLQGVFSSLGTVPDAGQLRKLISHFELLEHWNRRINLTSIRDRREVAIRHFGESLFLADAIPGNEGTLVDIGSGAGFPGVPIAVMRPQFHVTLVESVAKKVTFLKEVTREYRNVTVVQARAESVDGRFDWATMRAVAPAPLLLYLSQQVKGVGLLIGERDAAELTGSPLFEWAPAQPLPWGDRRVLLLGRSGRA